MYSNSLLERMCNSKLQGANWSLTSSTALERQVERRRDRVECFSAERSPVVGFRPSSARLCMQMKPDLGARGGGGGRQLRRSGYNGHSALAQPKLLNCRSK
jgi:hypothetical protein